MVIKYDESSNGYDYNNIVYVNQSSGSAFSSTVQFLLADNPEAGKYIMIMGGNGTADKLEFYIGTPTGYMDKECDRIWKTDGAIAFAWEDINFSEYSSVIIMSNDNAYCVALSEFSIPKNVDGPVSIGMQLTDVPEDSTIKAYLSKGSFSENILDVSEIYNED